MNLQHLRSSLLALALAMAAPFLLSAQSEPSTAAWAEDIRFLQATVHEDYPHLFQKTSAEAFDAEVEALLTALPQLERHEVVVGMARLVASFGWGHTTLPLFSGAVGFPQAPVKLYRFSDGFFIEGAAPEHAELVGAEVLAVAGVPVAEAFAKVLPAFPAENEQFALAYGMGLLTTPAILHAQGLTEELEPSISLTLRQDDGAEEEVALTALEAGQQPDAYGFTPVDGEWASLRSPDATPYYLDSLDRHYYHTYLPEEDAVYVRYSSVTPNGRKNIPSFFAEVFDAVEASEANKLILDVRLNGGGDNSNNVAVIKQLLASPQVNRVGHLFVLTGRRTFSACQNLVNELDTYSEAIFVGEPTGENVNFWGDNRRVELPNSGLPVYLSWAWWQDKPQWRDASATVPHVPVVMTAAQYASNEDPVLAAALAFDEVDFVRDPMARITELFMAGNMEGLQRELGRMMPNPAYRFFDFEAEFDAAGRQLIAIGQKEAAVQVLGMNRQLFPQSATTANSLAAAMAEVGDVNAAIGLSQESIQIAPDGPAAAEARARIQALSEG